MLITRNRVTLLIALFVFLAIATVIYRQNFRLNIINISPSGNSISSLTPYIEVTFNKEISSIRDVTIQPNQSILKSFSYSGKKLTIYINNINDHNSLELKLLGVESVGGYKIESDTIEYASIHTSGEEELSGEQLQYILEEQDAFVVKNSDPVLAHVPHSTLSYEINPDVSRSNEDGSNIVDLNVKILLSAADVRIGEDSAIKLYKKQAIEYLGSKGIKVGEYKINYEVIKPSL